MASLSTPQIVGVIFTPADLRHALRMRNPPDLFELRLDALGTGNELSDAIDGLPAPLIITARHPREGGSNRLPARERRALLMRFLPCAAYVDIELRAAATLSAILEKARAQGIRTILSCHDFQETPSRTRLDAMAERAESMGADILKIVTRTDTRAELTTLLDFFLRQRAQLKIAAMGVGRFGRNARLEFARRGSVLNYAHLGKPQIQGQLSMKELRRVLR
jgi:3-dehydroquinate dehydratase-1